jgi:hypothetical protein
VRDRLFVLGPGFADARKGAGAFFCPYSAQVIGFLAYYPEVRDTLELVELGFEKPREPLASLLGEAHQAAPLLVLGDERDAAPAGVPIQTANGHRFVERTLDILRYLAATRGLPAPH